MHDQALKKRGFKDIHNDSAERAGGRKTRMRQSGTQEIQLPLDHLAMM